MRFLTRKSIIDRIKDEYAHSIYMNRQQIAAVILDKIEWTEFDQKGESNGHELLEMFDKNKISVIHEDYWCVSGLELIEQNRSLECQNKNA